MGLYMDYKVGVATLVLAFVFFSSAAQKLPARVYDGSNRQWQPEADKEYYLVLRNNKCCLKCFTELDEYIADSLRSGDIYCITVVDSTVFARKNAMAQNVQLFPHLKESLFSYGASDFSFGDDKSASPLFQLFNIDITPAVIHIKNGQLQCIRYKDLFGKNANMNILKDLQ